ncbi:uncharacterized protein CELE_F46H6.5 [Caenorhabditis elegans]|uniref:Uncharacterized protein n=1 Tax=Caenorhabditis elegans TaxID=6239 RepID=Q6AHP6_CAEEL|nr:Uncharacterized protein CELE_F46H6.5 [Caenorhabditis elegans]CCD63479.1 Uncharacterized protein CELE_F46H6.5 [Caenorhabditis elegans]|eukprot:NP_001024682.1 Uncharacterized protein CELE_F46H6.5 [Caenorhabditis elegans]
MTGTALSDVHIQQWQLEKENNEKRVYNLCEVCFKPFNLANIDMHLEAGCAAEIYNRYNLTPIDNNNNCQNSTSSQQNNMTHKPKKSKKVIRVLKNKRKKKATSK